MEILFPFCSREHIQPLSPPVSINSVTLFTTTFSLLLFEQAALTTRRQFPHNQLNVDGITEHSNRNMHWQVKIEFLIINASEKVILRATDRNVGNFTSDTWNLHINDTLFKSLGCVSLPFIRQYCNDILLNRLYPSIDLIMGTSKTKRSNRQYPRDWVGWGFSKHTPTDLHPLLLNVVYAYCLCKHICS